MLQFKDWLKKNGSVKTNTGRSDGKSKKAGGNKNGTFTSKKTGSNIKI